MFLTAYSDRDTLQRARETGAFNYLIKPAGKEELITTVELSLHESTKSPHPTNCPAFNSSDNIIVVTDRYGKVLFFNSQIEKLSNNLDETESINIQDLLFQYFDLIDAPDFIKRKIFFP